MMHSQGWAMARSGVAVTEGDPINFLVASPEKRPTLPKLNEINLGNFCAIITVQAPLNLCRLTCG